MFLKSEMSQRCKPGPVTTPRPESPGRFTPVGTLAKALVLNHFAAVCGAFELGSPTKSGRPPAADGPSKPMPPGSLAERVTVKGKPVSATVMPDNSHPPSRCRAALIAKEGQFVNIIDRQDMPPIELRPPVFCADVVRVHRRGRAVGLAVG